MASSVLKNVSLDLIWTNEDPTQTFNPQTINLNVNGYRGINVLFRYSASVSVTFNAVLFGNDSVNVLGFAGDGMVRRTVGKYGGRVQFYDCYIWNNYGGSASSNNNYMIPFKIYGIK